jgi:hypothetical protein
MVFPATPEDVVAEIFVTTASTGVAAWTDITSDIRLSDQITVGYGYSSVTRSSTAPPASCAFTIDNTIGNYSPRNPLGAYYGSIGQNTPLRVASRVARDTFTRTTSNGWGSGTTGQAWTAVGTASQFATTGSAGTLSFTAASQTLLAYQAGQLYRDIDMAASFTFPFSNVTGGAVACGLALNGITTSDYFLIKLTISTAEAMTVDIVHISGSVIATASVSSFAYTGQQIRMKAQLSGQTLRAKIWPTTSPEPYAWLVEGTYVEGTTEGTVYADRGKGWIGIYGATGAAQSNVTYALSVDDLDVRINQFHGEATTWPTEWDVSGNNIFGHVEAAGLRRRLSQGQAPLPSTYTRANLNITPAHLLYFPVEEGSKAVSIASGVANASPMIIDTTNGSPSFASNSDFSPGSASIGKPNGSRWYSPRISPASTGKIQLIFLLSIPSTGEVDAATFTQIQCTGTVGFVDCYYDIAGTGSLHLKFYDQGRNLVHTSVALVPLGHNLNGTPVQVSIELTQSGADIAYIGSFLAPGDSLGSAVGGTVVGYTFLSPIGFYVDPYAQVASSAIGHIALRNDITSIFTNASALSAYNGEGIRTRMIRLCGENDSINFSRTRSTINDQVLLGQQKQNTFLALLDEAVKADMGFLLESRDITGLVLFVMRALYNRDKFVTLDYSTGQVQPPFKAVDDDQLIINDFTASKIDGSFYRATQSTGRLALTSPTSGVGVGRYNDSASYSLSSDSYLPDMATWIVHVGTADESRYPSIVADLSKLAPSSTQLYLDLLGVWVGDRIEITNPKSTHITTTVSQLVYGYKRRFGGMHHTIDFTCAPALPYTVAEAASDTGDTNPWLGRLDTDNSQLAAAASAGATSLKVATMSGPLWTTATDDYPLYLDVGGIQVRATAITSENLANTGFETNIAGWTASGLTSFTQSGTQKHSGSFAARLVPTGVATSCAILSDLVAVRAGESLTVSCWAWFTSSVTTNYCAAINWYDSSQVYISTSFTMRSATLATWTQDTATYTAPAGAAYAAAAPLLGGTPAAAQVWYVDDCSLTGPQTFTVDALPVARAVGLSVSVWHLPVLGQ